MCGCGLDEPSRQYRSLPLLACHLSAEPCPISLRLYSCLAQTLWLTLSMRFLTPPYPPGGAAHLPGMVAAMTPLPVVGVPVKPSGAHLDGLDALLSIVQVEVEGAKLGAGRHA